MHTTQDMKGTLVAEIESKSFEILVREHHRRLLTYAQSLIHDAVSAEDVVQEAFVTAYRKMDTFDAGRDFGVWVRGIIRFKALEWRRGRGEQPLDDAVLERLDQRQARLDRRLASCDRRPRSLRRRALPSLRWD